MNSELVTNLLSDAIALYPEEFSIMNECNKISVPLIELIDKFSVESSKPLSERNIKLDDVHKYHKYTSDMKDLQTRMKDMISSFDDMHPSRNLIDLELNQTIKSAFTSAFNEIGLMILSCDRILLLLLGSCNN